jgi:hypothetical protein
MPKNSNQHTTMHHRIFHRIEGSNYAVALHHTGGKRPYIVVDTRTILPVSGRFKSAGAAAVAAATRYLKEVGSL